MLPPFLHHWNALRKSAGYGHFLIATARKEENITSGNVTLSVFASEVVEAQFEEMLDSKMLVRTDIPGVYSVVGLTDIPFHAVLLGELEGEAYAAYRVLKKHAEIADVEYLLCELKNANEGNDQNKIDRLHRILDLVEKKNHGNVAEKIRGDKAMKIVFMDILKPEIDEKVKTAVNTAVTDSTRTNFFLYVRDGDMKIENAARRANLSVDDFRAQLDDYMAKHGAGAS